MAVGKKTQMILFANKNIKQTDIWEKNPMKNEKTKNVLAVWK